MNTPLELSEIGLQEEWSFRVPSRGGGGGEKRGRKEGRKREGQDVCEEEKEEVSSRGKEMEEGNFSTFPIDFILHSPRPVPRLFTNPRAFSHARTFRRSCTGRFISEETMK